MEKEDVLSYLEKQDSRIKQTSPEILMPEMLRELGMDEEVIDDEISKKRVITRDNFKTLVIELMF